ncbi:MAG: hypothetical protein ABF636_05750 [Acetobacter sp.]
MTIATCYLSPEGIVFGADSTTTYSTNDQFQHFNYCQKVFEIGENSSLGLVTWGLGNLPPISYRTLIAQFSDQLEVNPPLSVKEVADRWVNLFYNKYSNLFSAEIAECKRLSAKQPYDSTMRPPPAEMRTVDEEIHFFKMCSNLSAGFCIGGYVKGNRDPYAYEIIFDPANGSPTPTELGHSHFFWGMPSFINRLINGCSDELRMSILNNPHWTGTSDDLNALIDEGRLQHPYTVPIREAIDFSHICLLTTIKAIKFSSFPRVCGGPVELAVITTDRNFRWVRHKRWDSALTEGTTDASSLYIG